MLLRVGLVLVLVCVATRAEESKRLLTDLLSQFICPIPMCYLSPECQGKTTHTSYMHMGDRLCPGCPTCQITDVTQGPVGKRRILGPLCPNIKCLDMMCPDGIKRTSHITVGGYFCQSCPVCHNNLLLGKRNPLLSLHMNCPIFECANPGFCRGGYVTSFVDANGVKCPGCPTCPFGSGLLPGDLHIG